MGQKPSKDDPQKTGDRHNRAASRKNRESRKHAKKNIDTAITTDGSVFNEKTQEEKIVIPQDEQNPEVKRQNNENSENDSPFLRSNQNKNIKEFTLSKEMDTFLQTDPNPNYQNHNRIRRFRHNLARQLQRADMQHVLVAFLKEGIFNQKDYFQIKSQLHPKWMCWRLVYILERKIRNDDVKGETTVFDLFLKCLRSHEISRSKLAARLIQESGDPCPSWCSDGKDKHILDLADGLILTPNLLGHVLNNVRCSSEQLSWWRWIPLELGLRNFRGVSPNSESSQLTFESEHNKLKNALYQWGTMEGFARGGLEILLLSLRNHDDACDINWKGLEKLLKSRRYST